MTAFAYLPLFIIACPLVAAFASVLVGERRYVLRTWLNGGCALLCIGLTSLLLWQVYLGQFYGLRYALLPTIDMVFHADTLSLLFVSLSVLLWFITTLYVLGYLRTSPHQGRFFAFFNLSVLCTIGIALAGNLMTLLIFYELLTLTTYPLVVHRGNPASMRAGRIYLTYTMIGGALLLVAVVWLKLLAGPLDFTAAGVLARTPGLDPRQLQWIFVLLIIGLGVKAALVPLHGWLPTAMVAPAPVSALLHAVAVVKAGAFGIVRVVYDVYGISLANALGMTTLLAIVASVTIIYGSWLALRQDDLKKRLAYSTVSQVVYITLGAAIAGPMATIGGIVHLVNQGLMKITLFFCAGNLAETIQVRRISAMAGVGRRMPWTMLAFTVAALGMIGLPPVAGFVSKWYLGYGGIQVGAYWVVGLLIVSSVLNAMYFLPILYAAWFKPSSADVGRREATPLLLIPPLVTAALALVVGITAYADINPLRWAILITEREYAITLAVHALANGSAAILWLLIALPLVMAAACLHRTLAAFTRRLLPLAALPALVAALAWPGAQDTTAWLFFRSTLALDATSQIWLLLAATLWFITSIYARDYLRDDHHQRRFYGAFLLAMAGNFGLIVSYDIYGFMTFFTLMSLGSYGLVIHQQTPLAVQAATKYMRWVIGSEMLLFAGLLGLATLLGNSAAVVDTTALPVWMVLSIVAGFGIKAGLPLLHSWLPQAHAVAPVPASALLSGIMVKAGILGWLRFLPLGTLSYQTIGGGLLLLATAGMVLAAIAGLLQQRVKTALAYSTISQLSVIAGAIGAGLYWPSLWPLLLPAVLLYAVQHALAKAALFLAVGIARSTLTSTKGCFIFWLMLLLPALSLIGLPWTIGYNAKLAIKAATSPITGTALWLGISTLLTTMLVCHILRLLRQENQAPQQSLVFSRYTLGAFYLLCTLVVVTYAAVMPLFGIAPLALNMARLASVLWPALLGLLLYIAAQRVIVKWRKSIALPSSKGRI